MTDIKSNIPTYAEEEIINNPEQEEIQELRGQLRTLEEENARLKNELAEQKRHAEKMDSLAWEMHEAKNKLEAENQELKLKIKLDEEDYLDNLRYGIYNDKGKEEKKKEILAIKKKLKEIKEKLEKKIGEEEDTTDWYDLGEITFLPYNYSHEFFISNGIRIKPKVFPELLMKDIEDKKIMLNNVTVKFLEFASWDFFGLEDYERNENKILNALAENNEEGIKEIKIIFNIIKLRNKIINLDRKKKFRVKIEKKEEVWGKREWSIFNEKNELRNIGAKIFSSKVELIEIEDNK